MWLSPNARAQVCPTPHQYAVYRIALGTAALVALSLPSAEPAEWLQLPRAVRNALHVLPYLLGLGLCLGAYRRTFAIAGALLAVVLAGLHHSSW
jgi:hypothetical protein